MMENRAKKYLDLKDKHQQEMNEFPIAFAFNDDQLEKAIVKLGAKKIQECTSILGCGDVLLKKDVKAFIEMSKRHAQEVRALFEDKKLAAEIFEYEMDNHEYAINWEGDADVLGAVGLKEEDLTTMGLQDAYVTAQRKHMTRAHEEWKVI